MYAHTHAYSSFPIYFFFSYHTENIFIHGSYSVEVQRRQREPGSGLFRPRVP